MLTAIGTYWHYFKRFKQFEFQCHVPTLQRVQENNAYPTIFSPIRPRTMNVWIPIGGCCLENNPQYYFDQVLVRKHKTLYLLVSSRNRLVCCFIDWQFIRPVLRHSREEMCSKVWICVRNEGLEPGFCDLEKSWSGLRTRWIIRIGLLLSITSTTSPWW